MKTQEQISAEVRAECEAINQALHDTRHFGLPINDALDDAQITWLETGDKAKALEELKQAWIKAQDGLAVIERAHKGALKYFVDIKNSIKKDIEKGILPDGYPRPLPERRARAWRIDPTV
jgi:hypothetical protein